MRALATPTGQRWLDSSEIGLVYEAQVTLGNAFQAPSARRDYLERLAGWRADRTGKPGTPGDELLKRARRLIIHLNALQRKANAREERETLVHPVLRLTRPKPVEDAGLPPVEGLRAEADAARPTGDRLREYDRERKRRARAREKVEREALAA